MMGERSRPETSHILLAYVQCSGLVLQALTVSARGDWLPHVDLAPTINRLNTSSPLRWRMLDHRRPRFLCHVVRAQ